MNEQVEIAQLKLELSQIQWRLKRIEGFLASFPTTAVGMPDEPFSDELFHEAVKVVAGLDKVSASVVQRRLKIGYARSARILDQLEKCELVSSQDGAKPRKVYQDKIQAYMEVNGGGDNKVAL